MVLYIQLGAGAGDLDYSAGYRDGFSHHIKKRSLNVDDRVIVVEANPFNISILTESWKLFPQVQVFNLAIVPNKHRKAQEIPFYYSVDDGPFFQMSSVKESHVRNSYPQSDIHRISIEAMGINEFLDMTCGGSGIELLAIDIEGLDLEVLHAIELERFDIHRISFEKTHAGPQLRNLYRKLSAFGFQKSGSGLDPHNSDELWVKGGSHLERIALFLKNLSHQLWEVQIPARHFIKSVFLRP